MAKAIAEGIKSEGLDVKLTHVHEAKIEDIKGIDGLVLGSGTYHHEIMPALEVFIELAKKLQKECGFFFNERFVSIIVPILFIQE